MANNTLCLLCCNQNNSKSYAILNNHHFKSFCKNLEEVKLLGGKGGNTNNNNEGGERAAVEENGFIASSLIAVLTSPQLPVNLIVCEGCQSLIEAAVVTNKSMKAVEQRVRALQLQLLEELHLLQGHTNGFFNQIKQISQTVQNADFNILIFNKNGGGEGGISSWLNRDLNLFRKRTLDVSDDLQFYQDRLNQVTLNNTTDNCPSQAPRHKNKIKLNVHRRPTKLPKNPVPGPLRIAKIEVEEAPQNPAVYGDTDDNNENSDIGLPDEDNTAGNSIQLDLPDHFNDDSLDFMEGDDGLAENEISGDDNDPLYSPPPAKIAKTKSSRNSLFSGAPEGNCVSCGERQEAFEKKVMALISDLRGPPRAALQKPSYADSIPFHLPVKSYDELTKLEDWLAEPEDNRDQLIRLCSTLGGNGFKKVVKGILKRLIGSKLATQINFVGANNKIKFKDTKTHRIVFDATRMNHGFENVTEDDVNKIIMEFFRYAKDLPH